MKLIDDFLNSITMYRLVLYYLTFLVAMAAGVSFFNVLPFNFLSLLVSVTIILTVCWATNTIFAKTFKAQTNIESVYISAFILILIITPIKTVQDLPFLFWISVWAMASKYIFAINKKHLFNPVAFGAVLIYFTLNSSVSWWVGNSYMAPLVLIGGLLILRKIRRFDLGISFFLAALFTILGLSALSGRDLLLTLQKALLDTPLLFFTFIMVTEPLTTPPTKELRIFYGSLVGFFFAPQVHIGSFFTTPEIALIIGNIFSYIVSPKDKLMLKLQQKLQIAPDINDFIFGLNKKLNFKAGQYMEWTLSHKNPDSRGNRRYFTLASSPTEDNIRLGVKFYPDPSSFKRELATLGSEQEIVATQLAGDFTLPNDQNKKLVFIAGGIGVTPFRSIIKFLLDTNQKRDIVLFYSNKLAADIVYKDVFDEASKTFGTKTIYTLTDINSVPSSWNGRVGIVSEEVIKEEVPDYKDRTFYISGPHSMVTAFEQTLKKMGVKNSQIKIDFFPGFA